MVYTELLAILCIVSFFALLAIGFPVALTLAISGLFWGYLGFGAGLFDLLPARIYGVTGTYTLIAIPLFVFMGVMLEKSKIADDLMDVIGHLAGGLRGGIIIVGVLMGATTGIVGATIVTLGLITLPALMRRGYHLPTACGTICASGTLGQIIPPSTILILLADILGQSVGTLFAAALFPGLVLSAIFCIYLFLLGVFRPNLVPPVALQEREAMSRTALVKATPRIALPPISLVLAVLGSIIGGVAAPTEAASWAPLAPSWWLLWQAGLTSTCCAKPRWRRHALPPA
jgi:tripartite ATP-independent transporter DctM subunit